MVLLVAIFMPSLTKAKALARRAVCAANIHQICLANYGYSAENDNFYVRAASDIVGQNLHRWHGVRSNVNVPFDPIKGPLAAYLRRGQVKQCPSFNDVFEQAGQHGANFEAGCGGYGYNSQYIGGRNDLYGFSGSAYSAKNADVSSPADTVMFTDTAFRQTTVEGEYYIEYSACESVFWHFVAGSIPSNMRPNPTIHFRHMETTVVMWADGHAGFEEMDLSAPYVTHAHMTAGETKAQGLGWFGPDSNELFDLE